MRILLAVDGSQYSDLAVDAVASQTWPSGSRIRVLSVAPKLLPPAGVFDAAPAAEAVLEVLDEADSLAQRAEERLAAAGHKAERLVRSGLAGRQIVEEAASWSADLVVVGSHGRSGLRRMFMGSVAEYVVRHAPCSVEVIKAQAGAPASPHAPAPSGGAGAR